MRSESIQELEFGVVQETKREGLLFGNGFSGILGFSPASTSNLITELKKEGTIDAPIVSLQLEGPYIKKQKQSHTKQKDGSSSLKTSDTTDRTEDTRSTRTSCSRQIKLIDEKNKVDNSNSIQKYKGTSMMRLGGMDESKYDLLSWFPVQKSDSGVYDNWRVSSLGNFTVKGNPFQSDASKVMTFGVEVDVFIYLVHLLELVLFSFCFITKHGILLTTSLDVIAVPDAELEKFVTENLKDYVKKTESGT